MALFNRSKVRRQKEKAQATLTKNRAGGRAYAASNELKLVSMLLTSFAEDQYYRKASKTFEELVVLLPTIDPKFAAQAAIYARNKFGMRSITHVLAAELAAYASGKPWAKAFYDQIVHRPDDMLETLAYFYFRGGRTVPNALKKGFAKAFDRFDSYQLAKYRGSSSDVKLVDLVNLVHPKPTQRNAKALRQLVKGKLRSTSTWEAKLSKAGQLATSQKEKAALKKDAWTELVTTGKIGYFALLRNLRNIAVQAPDLIPNVCELLTKRESVKRSLVLPFRFLTAMDAIKEAALPTGLHRCLVTALNKAIDLSLANVPKFSGRTLVVLDDSGSMTWGTVSKMNRRPIDIGALFATALYKSNDADMMVFSNDARYIQFNHGDTTQSISDKLVKGAVAGGTNFKSIFRRAKGKYNRIIILSDMQGWMGGGAPTKAFHDYRMRAAISPYIYSFDLSGYGSLQFPESRVFCLAGFSDKVFDIMKVLEVDRNALVNKIKSIKL